MVFKAFWVVTYAIYLGFEKTGKCLICEFMKRLGKPSAKRYAHHQVTFPNVDFFEVIISVGLNIKIAEGDAAGLTQAVGVTWEHCGQI